jgi:hypothetical protein
MVIAMFFVLDFVLVVESVRVSTLNAIEFARPSSIQKRNSLSAVRCRRKAHAKALPP